MTNGLVFNWERLDVGFAALGMTPLRNVSGPFAISSVDSESQSYTECLYIAYSQATFSIGLASYYSTVKSSFASMSHFLLQERIKIDVEILIM